VFAFDAGLGRDFLRHSRANGWSMAMGW